MYTFAKEKLIHETLEAFRGSLRRECVQHPVEVSRMVDLIQARLYDERLNVNLVREQCGLRNNNVSSRFRATMGLGPRQYIETRRIGAATLLLPYEQLEIFLIGMHVGYTYPESFTRAFRRCLRCGTKRPVIFPAASSRWWQLGGR